MDYSQPAIYVLSNKHHTVLYVGSTVNLLQRLESHLKRIMPSSFAARYNCDQLLYYELVSSVSDAYAREKQIKGWTRGKKITLIQKMNPRMADLKEEIV